MADSKAVIEITGDASGLAKAVGQAKESLTTLERATKVIAGLNIAEWALRAGEAFKNWGERMFSLVEGLDDLSEKTSLSVEFLDKLQQVATIGGHSLNDITASAARLGKTFSEALGGDKDAARLFTSLGIALKDSAGQARSYDDIWQETARTLVSAENQTVANAYAQKLMGKSVSELIPFLKDFDQYGDRASRVTTEQAAAAEKAKQAFNELKLAGEQFGITLTNAVVPPLTELLQKLKELQGLDLKGKFFAIFGGGQDDPAKRIADIDRMLKKLKEDRDALDPNAPGLRGARNKLNEFLDFGLSDTKGIDAQIAVLRAERQSLQGLLGSRAQGIPALGEPPGPKKTLDASGLVPPDDSALKEAQRLQELDKKGWIEVAETVFKTAEETDRAMAEIYDARNKADEKLQEEGDKSWVAYAEAVFKAAEETVTIWDESGEQRIEISKAQWDEQEKLAKESFEKQMKDFQKMLDGLAKDAEKNDKWARDLGLTFTSAFEDAIVRGEKLQKVLQSLIQDIAKIAIRETITKPGGEYLSSLFKIGGAAISAYFSGSSTQYGVQGGNPDEYYAYGGGKAIGGPVSAGSLYRVNESGMEYFRPNVDGQVIPMGQGGGGGNVVVNNNFMLGVQQTIQAEIRRLTPTIARTVEASWAARRSQGGSYARA